MTGKVSRLYPDVHAKHDQSQALAYLAQYVSQISSKPSPANSRSNALGAITAAQEESLTLLAHTHPANVRAHTRVLGRLDLPDVQNSSRIDGIMLDNTKKFEELKVLVTETQVQPNRLSTLNTSIKPPRLTFVLTNSPAPTVDKRHSFNTILFLCRS